MDLPVAARLRHLVPDWMAVTAALGTGVATLLVQFGVDRPGNGLAIVGGILGAVAIGGWFWWRSRDQVELNADQRAQVERALSTGEPSGDDAVDSAVLTRLEDRAQSSRPSSRWGARFEALGTLAMATACAVRLGAWWWLSVIFIGPWAVSVMLPRRVAGPTLDEFRASLAPSPR